MGVDVVVDVGLERYVEEIGMKVCDKRVLRLKFERTEEGREITEV